MNRTGPDPDVAAKLASQAGCEIADSTQLLDGSWSHRVECDDHQAKVRFLGLLAEYDAGLPDVRRIAELVVAGAADTSEQVERLQQFVQQRVTFTGERDETFSPTIRTLAHGVGDCDDSSRALMALLRSLAIPTKLATLPEGGVPLHVAPMVKLAGKWHWVEPSVAAQLGEHPLAAARRLGINTRPELAGLGTVNPDEPEAELGVRFLPLQWAALGAVTVAALGTMMQPPRSVFGPAALAGAGALSGWAFSVFPFVRDFELDDGYRCSAWLPEADDADRIEACNARFRQIKIRNAAIAAAAGAAIGLLAWRRK